MELARNGARNPPELLGQQASSGAIGPCPVGRYFFFERDEELRPRELLDLRDVLLDLRVLPVLRAVLPAALRVRDLAPVLRVLRVGLARRELEALFFAAVFFEERLEAPLVSPDLRRCLFTTRAASSSARPSLAPC